MGAGSVDGAGVIIQRHAPSGWRLPATAQFAKLPGMSHNASAARVAYYVHSVFGALFTPLRFNKDLSTTC
jgi:hypothetical protein